MGEATLISPIPPRTRKHFNPRFPWGKRLIMRCFPFSSVNFNPRFPWGKRLEMTSGTIELFLFQSTLPVGEATPSRAASIACFGVFQSTLPVGEATRDTNAPHLARFISIHASRGGSDDNLQYLCKACHDISIHASRGGSDKLRFWGIGKWY